MPHPHPQPDAPALLTIGFAIPDAVTEAICRDDTLFPPIQTHTHGWSVIRGIEDSAGEPMHLISSLPISDYPRFPRLAVGYTRLTREHGGVLEIAPFVNITLLKHLTRAVSALALALRWAWRTRGRPRRILLYGLTSAHLLPALLVARLCGARVAAMGTDMPSTPPFGEPLFRRTIRRLDRAMIAAAMRRLDGLIVLSPYLAADLAPQVPSLLVEGIVSPADATPTDPAVTPPARREPGVCTLMYAGGLLKSYGIGTLLDAFARLEGPGWRLWLTGKGNATDDIRAACARDPRITYWGFVPNETVRALLREADILVNPRAADALTRYCFQSKLIEYMAAGRPVIANHVPGIPDEYAPYLTTPADESAEALAAAIRALHAEGPQALDARGAAARQFVLEHKNHRLQGARMWEFLRGLGTARARTPAPKG